MQPGKNNKPLQVQVLGAKLFGNVYIKVQVVSHIADFTDIAFLFTGTAKRFFLLYKISSSNTQWTR